MIPAVSNPIASKKMHPAVSKMLAPSFRMSPNAKHRFDQLRLNIDLAGVTAVKLFIPFIHAPLALTLVQIYNIMASVTILTLDPTRIPESSATRNQQRQAWKETAKLIPLLLIPLLVLSWQLHLPVLRHGFAIPAIPGLLFGAYLDEFLFRNIIQPKIRQLGAGKRTAITIQSLLFTAVWWIASHSLALSLSAFLLGWFNGWIVYRYRSLWPVFLLSSLWRIAFTQ